MDKKEMKLALKNIESAIKNVEKKNFKLLFFVADSKGAPVGSLAYTYELAYRLKELGYKVQMLYAENEFVGVKDWMGEKYASLPHFNSQKDNIDVSPSDFLFIPELFSNVMAKTKPLPCKKIAILQSFNYLTELIPLGSSWESLGVRDCITTSKSMEERLKEIFPSTKTYVIRPSIDSVFSQTKKAKLIVNIISKDENDINRVVKPFKWRYPIYDFVTFRYINGRSREEEAEYLREGAISIWIDDKTDFGYTALEAMASGNIVIGKIPENTPEWMLDKDGELIDNGVWFYKMRELPGLLSSVIQTLLYDKIPQGLYENMEETVSNYTEEKQLQDIKTVLEEVFETREKELHLMADALKNNLNEDTKKD